MHSEKHSRIAYIQGHNFFHEKSAVQVCIPFCIQKKFSALKLHEIIVRIWKNKIFFLGLRLLSK